MSYLVISCELWSFANTPFSHCGWCSHRCTQISVDGWRLPRSMADLWSDYSITALGYHRCALPVSGLIHYSDAIMSSMASQITNLTIVYSTFYSGADQRKHQSPASLASLWGDSTGCRWIPRTKGQWPRKCFRLMTSPCNRDPGKELTMLLII